MWKDHRTRRSDDLFYVSIPLSTITVGRGTPRVLPRADALTAPAPADCRPPSPDRRGRRSLRLFLIDIVGEGLCPLPCDRTGPIRISAPTSRNFAPVLLSPPKNHPCRRLPPIQRCAGVGTPYKPGHPHTHAPTPPHPLTKNYPPPPILRVYVTTIICNQLPKRAQKKEPAITAGSFDDRRDFPQLRVLTHWAYLAMLASRAAASAPLVST